MATRPAVKRGPLRERQARAAGLVLEADIPIRPIPKGSLEPLGHGVLRESNPRTKPHLDATVLVLNTVRAQHPRSRDFPLDVGVEVAVHFYFERPQGVPIEARPDDVTTGDLDKLTRLVFDALTKAKIVADDARMVDLVARSWYGEGDVTRMTVQAAVDGTGQRPQPGLF